jgi:hypothetical protein
MTAHWNGSTTRFMSSVANKRNAKPEGEMRTAIAFSHKLLDDHQLRGAQCFSRRGCGLVRRGAGSAARGISQGLPATSVSYVGVT